MSNFEKFISAMSKFVSVPSIRELRFDGEKAYYKDKVLFEVCDFDLLYNDDEIEGFVFATALIITHIENW